MKAHLIGPLVYFDGPQLALLSAGKSKLMAVAIEKEGMDYAFFCCAPYKHHLNKYMEGKADLYFLFENSAMGRYFFFDWNQLDQDRSIKLIKASEADILNPDYWPQRGFFSTAHTESTHYSYRSTTSNVVSQAFNIDGVWDASEFSSFYGKMSDVYAIFYAKNRMLNSVPGDDTLRKIKDDVITRLWRGGGSYSGFYNAMERFLPGMNPLTVSKIQWASPGSMVFRGHEEIFSEMLSSLASYSSISRSIDEHYREIDRTLSKNKLKSASPTARIGNSDDEDSVKSRANAIMEAMGMDRNDDFIAACEGNILVYAKLAMSIHRRFKGIHTFISEGRVDPCSSGSQ